MVEKLPPVSTDFSIIKKKGPSPVPDYSNISLCEENIPVQNGEVQSDDSG